MRSDHIEANASRLLKGHQGCRDQDRLNWNKAALAALLFQRLWHALPQTMGPLTVRGLNPRLRLYRYRPGQRFALHIDHWHQFDSRTRIVPRNGLAALWQHKLTHEGLAVHGGLKYALRSD